MTTRTIARIGAGIAGAALLAGVATAATAAEIGDDSVDVSVDIAAVEGALALTIDGDSSVLTEDGSTSDVRQFTGALPTVTVTDTRAADTIPTEAFWTVLGSASDFTTGEGDVIGAEHLGWQPRLIDAGNSGLVNEGDRVDTAVDEGDDAVGLVDQELFASAINSREASEASEGGRWTATADLFLRTPADIAPGAYSGTLTLSLFE